MTSLIVERLTKRFGPVTAVDDLSFTVHQGLVTGLVGPNGSGKSTTMRAALGLIAPTSGRVLVDRTEYRRLERPLTQVGAVLDAGAVNGAMTGRRHLRWLAASNAIADHRAAELLDLVGLNGSARRRIGGYSLGMRQRLGIAAALLGDPPILVFDEPMNGLDPEGIVWLRGFLRDRAGEGRIVLRVQGWSPFAGFSIQHTVDRDDYYTAPWVGLAVLAVYAVTALVLGVVVTRRRDV